MPSTQSKPLLVFDLDKTIIRDGLVFSKRWLLARPLGELVICLESMKLVLGYAQEGRVNVAVITWNLDLTPNDPDEIGGRRLVRFVFDQIHGSDTTSFIPDSAIISERPNGEAREAFGKNASLRLLIDSYQPSKVHFFDDNDQNIKCAQDLIKRDKFCKEHEFKAFWTPNGYGKGLPKLELKIFDQLQNKRFVRMSARNINDVPMFNFAMTSTNPLTDFLSLSSDGASLDLHSVKSDGKWSDFLNFVAYLSRKIKSLKIECVPQGESVQKC